jgi:hypothetical protein
VLNGLTKYELRRMLSPKRETIGRENGRLLGPAGRLASPRGKIIERPRVEITRYRCPRVRYLALVDGRMAATSLDRASPPLSEAL